MDMDINWCINMNKFKSLINKIKKKFRFKSLTMRIWTTFTAIILIIICSISFLYLVAYRKVDEKAKAQDLLVAHDFLLKSKNFSEPDRFDEMRNLKGSEHFIVKISSNSVQITGLDKEKNNLPPHDLKMTPPPMNEDYAVKSWMAGYINGSMNEKQFIKKYKNMNFIFIISSINTAGTEKQYLISYTPDMQDNSWLYMVIIIGAVFIFIGFITAKIVAGYISKPLSELEKFTVRVAHKDWKEPIEVKSDDEIGRLMVSMNRMQSELRHADEEEKKFLQSISHDLKTPVMVIMSHAEAIIDGVYIDSVEKTAEIIRNEAILLNKKIKNLLYLNTLDYVLENNKENETINLHNLILNIVNRFEAINSKIQWDMDLDEVNIYGNADKIQVAIENIIDNGLRYANEKISINVKKEDSFAVLKIYNDGPNIDADHINNIFDNFYKDKTGNFGLGLAISKKIIDFYKGEIKAENNSIGVTFTIKYPLIK
jgi:two-component system sensor histidine kinase CssS